MSAKSQAGPAELASENGNVHQESPNQTQPEEGIKGKNLVLFARLTSFFNIFPKSN